LTSELIELLQSLLETLLILATLSIALISIVIAVFAIGVSYQGRETQRSRLRKKKRRDELERKIKELGNRADVEGVREEIVGYDKEIAEIDDKLFYLSIWGTVILPIACFLFALITVTTLVAVDPTGINMPLPSMGQSIEIPISYFFTGVAVSAIAVGVYFQIKTLFAIEWAASKIPVPEFEICFEDGTKKMKSKSNETKTIMVGVTNKGEDIAENLQIFLFFPPSFKVNNGVGYTIAKQGTESDYSGYNAAVIVADYIHSDVNLCTNIGLIMPEARSVYEIPVYIYERKTGANRDKLVIEIIE